MSEKEKEIIVTLARLIPKMSESEKSYWLGYGDAIAAREELKVNKQDEKKAG